MCTMPFCIIPSSELWVTEQTVIYMYHAEAKGGPSDGNREAEDKQSPEVALLAERNVWFLLKPKAQKNISKFSERQTEMS